MSAKIYYFPEPRINYGYKIPLYTDEEVLITSIASNTFGNYSFKITETNLSSLDPVLVIGHLTKAKNSDIFSNQYKRIISRILGAVESIEMRG